MEIEIFNELMTLRDHVRYAMTCFGKANLCYGHGTDNALDEARALVFPLLHLPWNLPPDMLDSCLTAAECELLQLAIARRTHERMPTAYITRQAWFAGMPFYVDERVLIPRSPLAEVIEEGFAPWIAPEAITRVLDLCTGSGALAIATAVALPEVAVDAVDISAEVLAVAQINVDKHQLQQQVRLIQSDGFAQLAGQRYDVIVSNPPYVSAAEYAELPAEYLYEPRLALVAEDQGLALVHTILTQAADYLTAQGILIVEVGNSASLVAERFAELPLLWLEFSRGGEGVFLLTQQQLLQWRQTNGR